jgi:RNA polymerase sigma factor (sigma-70 family)
VSAQSERQGGDAILLANLNQGFNQNDFKVIFEGYYPKICRLVTCVLGNRHAAEEVAQETFVKLYQTPPKKQNNLGGWLAKVATNLAYNRKRSENSRLKYELEVKQISRVGEPEEELLLAEEAALTRKALELIPERDRLCILLKFSGLDYSEIAKVIGVKESSVGTILARARTKFKEEYLRLKGCDTNEL